MLVVDAYSKWPEVVMMESTTAETMIKHLQQIFATHGLPLQIVSDNGPQFTAEKFQQFLNQGCAWFLQITFMPPKYVCAYACVCSPPRPQITSGMILTLMIG